MKHSIPLLLLCVTAFFLGHWNGRNSSVPTGAVPGRLNGKVESVPPSVVTATTNPTYISEIRYDDGPLKQITVHHQNSRLQSSILYYPQGGIKAIETRYGEARTVVCAYFTEDGTPGTCGIYSPNDLLVGTFRQFYGQYTTAPDESRGRLYIQHERYGCRESLRTVLWPNGRTKSVTPYRDNTPHGPSQEYAKDGSLDCVREYEDGAETRRTGYIKNGQKTYLSVVDDGEGNKVWINFYENGEIRSKQTERASGRGTIVEYARDGRISEKTTKLWRFPLHKREYYPSGETKAPGPVSINTYSPDGNLMLVASPCPTSQKSTIQLYLGAFDP